MVGVLSRLSTRMVGMAAGLAGLAVLSACEMGSPTASSGSYNGAPVAVALLVPSGSGDATDDLIARGLENAARMAIADLGGVKIDLRVYPTAANQGRRRGRQDHPWPLQRAGSRQSRRCRQSARRECARILQQPRCSGRQCLYSWPDVRKHGLTSGLLCRRQGSKPDHDHLRQNRWRRRRQGCHPKRRCVLWRQRGGSGNF
jgi:hypothetical protein